MKCHNKFDLLTRDRCFDIHREDFDEIKVEMFIFYNEVLCKMHSNGQDEYPYSYLYRHSYDVLKQILEEYFAYYDRQIESKK